MSTQSIIAPLLALLVVACAPDKGQVGEETISCAAVSTESLARDEASPLGFSPAQILSFSEGEHTGSVLWADSQQSEATLKLEFTGESNYQVRDWLDEEGELAEQQLEIDCPNIVEIEMLVTMSSADGRLDESWTVLLIASSAHEASLSLAPESFGGSLDVGTFAPAGEFVGHQAFVYLDFESGSLVGRLSGQSESSSGSSDNDVVSAVSYDIASFEF